MRHEENDATVVAECPEGAKESSQKRGVVVYQDKDGSQVIRIASSNKACTRKRHRFPEYSRKNGD